MRRPKQPPQGRLKSKSGEILESEQWPERMAEHLGEVQWRERPTADVGGHALGPPLGRKTGNFISSEVRDAVGKTKRNKSAGLDDVPAEYWQAIAEDGFLLKVDERIM